MATFWCRAIQRLRSDSGYNGFVVLMEVQSSMRCQFPRMAHGIRIAQITRQVPFISIGNYSLSVSETPQLLEKRILDQHWIPVP